MRKASFVRMSENNELFWKLLEPEYVSGMMFCRKLMGDRDSGDDLYHDVVVTALEKLADLKDPGSFRPWFYRIMINTFRSTIRRPWWKRRVWLSPEIEALMVDPDPTDGHARRRWLGRAFQAVSSEEQALVTLYEMEGWTIGELAELYGKTEGAIKLRLFRARRKMRDAVIKFLKRSQFARATATLLGKEDGCAAAESGLD
jgi:RNA polymerase sigma factor (sigma-70 family)